MTAENTEGKMQYVRLGNSGLKVSRIILGLMSYGTPEWADWVLGEEEGIKHIKTAYDFGIQTFDTANAYSNGLSEVILGKAIKQHSLPRDEIVVMTKAYSLVGRTPQEKYTSVKGVADGVDALGYVNQYGLSRKIFESVKHSLERLQLDYIDVLQCHRFDYNTPIAETMQALHDVVQAGYVRYIGMSSCYAYQFHAMQNYAINNKLTPFISMQNQYNLLYREEEPEMMPTLKMLGVGMIPWYPLAGGALAHPTSKVTLRSSTDTALAAIVNMGDASQEIIKRVEKVAKKRNVSMAQVATAWTLCKDVISAPIVGTTKLQNLDVVGAVRLRLTDEEMEYLEEPYVPQNVRSH
ncbi:aldo/keto reductase family protein [Ceratobasidium sp. AG-Ba]|nr:aldo/keto reductase family protein [Ceratobasidium sp. AG-Ba]